eukprot:11292249-Karenia_brevis.AAC.1
MRHCPAMLPGCPGMEMRCAISTAAAWVTAWLSVAIRSSTAMSGRGCITQWLLIPTVVPWVSSTWKPHSGATNAHSHAFTRLAVAWSCRSWQRVGP